MTTIATDGKIVAYDSRATQYHRNIVSDKANKLIIIDDVFYIGCGADADINRMIEKYSKEESSDTDFECDVWASYGDGILYRINVDEKGASKDDISQYGNSSIGSGADFALAALDFGKSPIEAVKYAMTRDFRTGGKVKTFKLKR